MSKVYTDNIEKRTGGTAMAVPATGKWPTANIADDAITATQIAADAVDTSEIAANAVTLAEMAGLTRGSIIVGDASGDPSALTKGTAAQVLTSDGTDAAWAAASGGDNTPAFLVGTADDTAITGITSDTLTKVAFGTEQFDTDSAYDTTNYRFTVPAGEGGKYMIYFNLEQHTSVDTQNTLLESAAVVYLNGATPAVQNASGMHVYSRNSTRRRQSIQGTGVLQLSAADYIELYCKITCSGGTGTIVYRSWWGGYKLLL